MSVKNRTAEFHAIVEAALAQQTGVSSVYNLHSASDTQRLLGSGGGGGGFDGNGPGQVQQLNRSEFAKAAAVIGRDLNTTVARLQSLTRLAKQKSLFDDRSQEINELIGRVKGDIGRIQGQIAGLSTWVRQNGDQAAAAAGQARGGGGGRQGQQAKEHTSNVISSLQGKLANTSNSFRTILEIRTQNMRQQKERRDQYSSNPASGASLLMPSSSSGGTGPGGGGGAGAGAGAGAALAGFASDSPLYNPDRRAYPNANSQTSWQSTNGITSRKPNGGQNSSSDTVIDFGSGSMAGGGDGGMGGQQMQQQQLIPTNTAINMEIVESRSQAIESIEATIAELGQIYQNFAAMVATQREMVQRIDENVLDIESNVTGAHSQLLKYYQNISGNRWLMMKVFAVVIVFFLLFVLIT